MKIEVISTTQRLRADIGGLRIEATATSAGSIESGTAINPDTAQLLASFTATPDGVNYYINTTDPDTSTALVTSILTFIQSATTR